MRCKKWRKLISFSLDGQLSGKDELKLTNHLQSCSACANYMQDMKKQQSALRKHRREQAPYYFNQAIKNKLDQPGTSQVGLSKKWGLVLASGAMATIIVVLVSQTTIFQPQPIEQVKQVAHQKRPLTLPNQTQPSKVLVQEPTNLVESVVTPASTDKVAVVAKQVIITTVEPTQTASAELMMVVKQDKHLAVLKPQPDSKQTKKIKSLFKRRRPGKKMARQKQPVSKDATTVNLSKVNVLDESVDHVKDTQNITPTVVSFDNTPMVPMLSAEVKIMNNKIRISQQDRMGIQIDLDHPTNLVVKIYNRQGKMIKSLHEGMFSTGRHNLEWDGTTSNGEYVGSGIYVMMIGGDIKPQKHKIAVIQ